jgi:hypothetical protein
MYRRHNASLASLISPLLRFAAAAVALASLVPQQAVAQGFGRTASQPWSGIVTVHNRMTPPGKPISNAARLGVREVPGSLAQPTNARPASAKSERASVNLAPFIQQWWDAQRPQYIAKAESFLHERDIGGGFRTSRNRLTLASSGPMLVGTDGYGFTVRYLLNGNSLSTYLRVPAGPLVNRDMDPGFLVRFDLDVTLDFTLRNNQLLAVPARIKANVHRPEGRNISGEMATAAANLARTLSGVDFIGQFLAVANSKPIAIDTGLNNELGMINPLLQKAASGGVIQPSYHAPNQSVVLTLVNSGPGPVVR